MEPAAAKQKRYIRDESKGPQGPGRTATATIGFVALALVLGFAIGFVVFAVMNLSSFLTGLLWNGLGGAVGIPVFPLVVCTLGGAVIGLWTWWSNDRVKPLDAVMKEFKETGSYKTNGAVKPVITFLLPLVFGGSIGFEAGLTGLITAGCCWIRDTLKRTGLRFVAVADATIAATIAAIFGTPLAGIVADLAATTCVAAQRSCSICPRRLVRLVASRRFRRSLARRAGCPALSRLGRLVQSTCGCFPALLWPTR